MIPSVAIILLCIGYLEADGIAVFLGIAVLLTMITGLVFMADWITKYLGTLWG
jgi:hypothetical protein